MFLYTSFVLNLREGWVSGEKRENTSKKVEKGDLPLPPLHYNAVAEKGKNLQRRP